MLIEKDYIDQFKRDLRSYDFNLKKIAMLNLELEAIAVKMQGVSSPAVKDVIIENKSFQTNILELMYEEEKLISERNHIIRGIEIIDDKLNKLNHSDRELLRVLYIDRRKYHKVAKERNYSQSTLFEQVDKIIKSIL